MPGASSRQCRVRSSQGASAGDGAVPFVGAKVDLKIVRPRPGSRPAGWIVQSFGKELVLTGSPANQEFRRSPAGSRNWYHCTKSTSNAHLEPIIEQVSDFRRTIGENIADCVVWGRSGSGLSLPRGSLSRLSPNSLARSTQLVRHVSNGSIVRAPGAVVNWCGGFSRWIEWSARAKRMVSQLVEPERAVAAQGGFQSSQGLVDMPTGSSPIARI